jgi:hypothetical protein
MGLRVRSANSIPAVAVGDRIVVVDQMFIRWECSVTAVNSPSNINAKFGPDNGITFTNIPHINTLGSNEGPPPYWRIFSDWPGDREG